MEVPKTLPGASLDERVKSLEEGVNKLITQLNTLKASPQPTSSSNSKLTDVEASVVDLKARVSALEKAPTPSTSGKSTSYIPLGAGGSWDYSSFTNLTDYQINLDPANFPGVTGMVLEVIFRVVDSTSTTSVRLYNTSDSSAVSSEVSTNSSNFTLAASSSFKLASGSKTYALQAKNSDGKTFFIQLARIRVNY